MLPAILAATVLHLLVGMVWYSSAMFGPQWIRLSGVDVGRPRYPMAQAMGVAIACAFVTSAVLAAVFDMIGAHTLADGGTIALLLWAGFFGATTLMGGMFHGDPPELMLINAGHDLARMVLAGAAIGAML